MRALIVGLLMVCACEPAIDGTDMSAPTFDAGEYAADLWLGCGGFCDSRDGGFPCCAECVHTCGIDRCCDFACASNYSGSSLVPGTPCRVGAPACRYYPTGLISWEVGCSDAGVTVCVDGPCPGSTIDM